jgi:hypothetical protein
MAPLTGDPQASCPSTVASTLSRFQQPENDIRRRSGDSTITPSGRPMEERSFMYRCWDCLSCLCRSRCSPQWNLGLRPSWQEGHGQEYGPPKREDLTCCLTADSSASRQSRRKPVQRGRQNSAFCSAGPSDRPQVLVLQQPHRGDRDLSRYHLGKETQGLVCYEPLWSDYSQKVAQWRSNHAEISRRNDVMPCE